MNTSASGTSSWSYSLRANFYALTPAETYYETVWQVPNIVGKVRCRQTQGPRGDRAARECLVFASLAESSDRSRLPGILRLGLYIITAMQKMCE